MHILSVTDLDLGARPNLPVLATTGDAGWTPDDSTFTKRGN